EGSFENDCRIHHDAETGDLIFGGHLGLCGQSHVRGGISSYSDSQRRETNRHYFDSRRASLPLETFRRLRFKIFKINFARGDMICRLSSDDMELAAHLVAETPLLQKYDFTYTKAKMQLGQALQDPLQDILISKEGDRLQGFAWFLRNGAF